ncbi:MAG: hypothetical protein EAZ61_07990 [Oscillatoriales cyanobacterium]|nr:MAG: hypothetical protein EAZ61_07990 [Oscillatoriales cyanobacterium]
MTRCEFGTNPGRSYNPQIDPSASQQSRKNNEEKTGNAIDKKYIEYPGSGLTHHKKFPSLSIMSHDWPFALPSAQIR